MEKGKGKALENHGTAVGSVGAGVAPCVGVMVGFVVGEGVDSLGDSLGLGEGN